MESDDKPSSQIAPINVRFWDIGLIKLLLLPLIATTSFLLFPGKHPIITLNEYNRIQSGMTVNQVDTIVGEPGGELEKRDPSAPGISNLRIFQWQNGSGSHALIWFQDGKVVLKINIDLK
ncbi:MULTISPECIES: hypothetical protein [unclassified Leptolyngbya]|uniref:hypothetical protein n=1 Tax=unclassified Leptolyngbya TaxID=2650499 RepID=UPI0016857A54|nr:MULTISPECIES: hypothetical protein [unclassified Leptolyngbya]MBD1913624.1 hypothetical protein [Leptolyngbya sp. FACHB-8]MBD2154045.1 hypothetical protein [Leptolyngbya sp. FACHB-16]